MTPEAKKRMEELAAKIFLKPNKTMEDDFKEGYQAGMQDPDSNKELLEECENSLEVLLYNNHASTLRFSDVAYKTLEKLRARGWK